MKELIHINLFDETMKDLVEDDRLRETNIHQQIGCNWLGKIEIPFSTLLYTNRVSTFIIKYIECLNIYRCISETN